MISDINHLLVDKIVQAHQDLQIQPSQTIEPHRFSQTDPVYQVTKLACLKLGFIERDAQSLALAWMRMNPNLEDLNPSSWPDQPEFFGIKGRDHANAFPSCPKQLGLYIVAPDAQWIKRLLEMGAKTVQLRFKSNDPKQIESEVAKTIQISHDFGTSAHVFINDYWELAIKYKAYGVHLGQEDMDQANLELIRSAGLRLGLSTHGYAEMIRADQFAPSYIALGAIFPTTLKQMETAPQGLARLRQYVKLMQSYPLVGIGGVNETNIDQVLNAGVGSAALVRAVINAENPEQSFNDLMRYF